MRRLRPFPPPRSPRRFRCRAALAAALMLAPTLPARAGETAAQRPVPSPNAVTMYAGAAVPTAFTGIFSEPYNMEFNDVYLLAIAYSHRLWTVEDHLTFELEGQIARRINEDVWEFGAALFVRWDDFPWSEHLYTSIGVGLFGPSFATRVTATEREKSKNGRGSKFLNLFIPEITLADPENPDLQAVIRVHHRSGVFGLIDGVSGGSNFLSLGLRYRF